MEFLDKKCLITGAGNGMGRATALEFAKKGADVIVNDINLVAARKVAKEIETLGRRALVIKADVTKKNEVEDMVNLSISKFGKIDILVNNIGEFGPNHPTIMELEEDEWDRKIRINLKSVYLCTHAVVNHMVKRKEGKIINVSSTGGKRGVPGYSHYCAAKFGVEGFTQSIAKELSKYGIRVNAVAPGLVDTQLGQRSRKVSAKVKGISYEDYIKSMCSKVPLGRLGSPEDIANVIVFLASKESDYITGQSITVSGGS
jgi:NAD(P)-dependent dehydrogenase (short-subunit alcohol dehydrogenase family)